MPRSSAHRSSLIALGLLAAIGQPVVAAADTSRAVTDYLRELEAAGIVDAATGNKDALRKEVAAAETLLRSGALMEAAVALYGIVESPRFSDFDDFVEFHNAEYYLAVALARAGAYYSALTYLERVMNRGPGTLYFAPAHRRAVDIAIETRDYEGVLARLEGLKLNQAIPPGASGERAYLRGRIAYTAGDFTRAEGELAKISRKSRLYSSALYLRGVIRARKGQLSSAADAFCEIADTPDNDKFTFVVDDRYFTIKDLARLGLGRLAHEADEYDDSYYHYFQIPQDSDHLPQALFEATWSMYQKRELSTARDLADEFLTSFSTSPITPEAELLAGYIELADCKFEAAQQHYDGLVKWLQPVVDEIAKIRTDADLRAKLFDDALARWQEESSNPQQRAEFPRETARDEVLGLLRLDPEFIRLNDAIIGLRTAASSAPFVHKSWRALGRRVARVDVSKSQAEFDFEADASGDATILLEDVRRLSDEIAKARQEIRRGRRDGTMTAEAAQAEEQRLRALDGDATTLEERVEAAVESLETRLPASVPGKIGPMIQGDIAASAALSGESRALLGRLSTTADELAVEALDRLYQETRKVLDKAKLGKIDAVIGQKRRLEIEVQDLAMGRFPAELHGKLWEKGLIGDDEVFWPFEGEYWKDEYEGWR